MRDLPVHLHGARPAGLPHSPWELLEHIRIAQRDILNFSLTARYDSLEWPSGYWPPSPEPPVPEAWERSVAAVREDRDRLQELRATLGLISSPSRHMAPIKRTCASCSWWSTTLPTTWGSW